MPNIMTMEAANLFCGQDGESNHLRLTNVRLPTLEEAYVDHRAGGAPVAIEVDIMLNRLQCDFHLVGWSPDVDKLISAWSAKANNFKFFGALRDRNTGEVYQAYSQIFGRLGAARSSAWQRGDLFGTDYTIRGIIHYSLTVADVEIFKWDFFENTMTTAS